MWGHGVEKLLYKYNDTPILGLSATAIRYLDNQRNMADELFDGNIASEMSLGEAIGRGILQPPKYVQTVFSYQNELGKYEKRISHLKNKATRDKAERYLEALKRALEMADGLDRVFEKHMTDRSGKYIVFCSNADHMREMIGKTDEWFSFLDNEPHIYSVYSDDPETSREFAEFKNDNSDRMKLLFCIDMLNEGIYVDYISGVILFRPTVSPTVYKQQIGRALAADNSRTPLILDVVNNIENLYSIGAIAKHYYSVFGDLEVPASYKTSDGFGLGDWISNQRESYREGTLKSERIRRLDSIGMVWTKPDPWELRYSMAAAFYREHGHLRVPTNYRIGKVNLNKWVNEQKQVYRGKREGKALSSEQVARLERIGIEWSSGNNATLS